MELRETMGQSDVDLPRETIIKNKLQDMNEFISEMNHVWLGVFILNHE
jgi:hypothetical protein